MTILKEGGGNLRDTSGVYYRRSRVYDARFCREIPRLPTARLTHTSALRVRLRAASSAG